MSFQMHQLLRRDPSQVRTVLLSHVLLSLAAVAAITVLAILKDVEPTTAVIVILAATGIGSSSNSTIQALLNAKSYVDATTAQSNGHSTQGEGK